MATNQALLSGGQLVVAALRAHRVDMAFSVAGESYLEVLDALFDAPDIRLVTCRQEGGAAFMAEAYGKLTGKPGVLMVTRGPGACNASIGIHTAFQDSTPMVVLVGQVARHQIDREAFQEVDFRRMFAPLAKWVAQIDIAERVPELINQAFQVASSGRPGPVVLALPEDMLRDRCAAPVAGPYRAVRAHPGAADLAELRRLLTASERPMMLVGGSGWSAAACRDIASFAQANELPVCCSFRRQDIVDNRLPCFVGDLGTGASPSLVARLRQADLLLAVGARIGEITSQSYSLLGIPEPGKILIHVHTAAEELGRVFRPTLAIQSGMPEFAAAAAALAPVAAKRWSPWQEAARAEYKAGLVAPPSGGSLDLGEIMGWLRDRLPDDAIVTSDAGNFSGWPNRFLQYRRPGRQLGPTSGAMGYGVPAAVAAKLVHPDRLVVGFCGDGGFMMTGQELATAMLEGTGPIILVFNNAMYGTIRMHQERRFPGRVVGTALKNPDFLALARAYGVFGASVVRTAEFAPAFEEAASSSRAAIIEIKMDPEMITTRSTLSEIRRQAEAPVRAGRGMSMAGTVEQHWSARRYAETAHFVPELGAPGLDLLAPRAGERILDLGCGDGALTEKIVAAGAEVVAIDAAPDMVAAARARGIDARVMPGQNLTFDREFDAVFSNAALHWMRPRDAVLTGVRRALKPGGRFIGEMGGHNNTAAIIVALSAVLGRRGLDAHRLSPWYFPSAAAYRGKLAAAGFTVEDIRIVPRPTTLPNSIEPWLETFGEAFFGALPEPDRTPARAEVANLLRPVLVDETGTWIADYVRLRFRATVPP